MKLIDYRKQVAKVSRAKAAKALACDPVQIWRWETGRSVPRPETILAIVKWSGGKVEAGTLLAAAKEARHG